MGLLVLIMLLSLFAPRATYADCVSLCFSCALQIQATNSHFNPLVCSLQCEGSLTSVTEWERCEKILSPVLEISKKEQERVPTASDLQDVPVKRYGGFIKKHDKNRFFFNSPKRERAIYTEDASKPYSGVPLKYEVRDLQETPDSEQETEVNDESEEQNQAWTARDESKRYGGFLRKYPKRSLEDLQGVELGRRMILDPGQGVEEVETEQGVEAEHGVADLQKRYGGFMRRIRPKLKWDNQKRYGGFLRRQFKVTTRSEEDPSTVSGELSNL